VHSLLVLVLVMVVAVGLMTEVDVFKGVLVRDMGVGFENKVVKGMGGVRPLMGEASILKGVYVVREFFREVEFKVEVVFEKCELSHNNGGMKIRSDGALIMSLTFLYTRVLILERHMQLTHAMRSQGITEMSK
jgi:hypothetical protein